MAAEFSRKEERQQSLGCIDDLDDISVLEVIDSYLHEKPERWFDVNPNSGCADTIKIKAAFDFIIDRYPKKLAGQCAAIFDALIYKMSAPYRHMTFWKSTRRVFKELSKINAVDLTSSLKKASEAVQNSGFQYPIRRSAVCYVGAVLLSLVVRARRLQPLCVRGAADCAAHLHLGHFVPTVLLLLSLLAEVYKQTKTHLSDLVDCYESIGALIPDKRFPVLLRRIRVIQEALSVKCSSLRSSLDTLRIITDSVQMTHDDFVLALSSKVDQAMNVDLSQLGAALDRETVEPKPNRVAENDVNLSRNDENFMNEGEKSRKRKLKRKKLEQRTERECSPEPIKKKKKRKRTLQPS